MNKNYDIWLHWNVTDKCGLQCEYCFSRTSSKMQISELKNLGIKNIPSLLRTKIKEKFEKHTDEIDIKSLINTLDNTNKTFRIGLTGGGDPFSVPNIVEACVEVTKKHYIAINSNIISKKIIKFGDNIDPDRVVHFHASAHIKELERLNLLDRYIENFLFLKKKGFDIFAQEVAHPTLLKDAKKYISFFNDKGIDLTFGPFCGEYNGKVYPASYTKNEVNVFGLREPDIIQRFYHKGKVCNAGYNACIVTKTGDIRPCHLIHKNLGNIYEEIKLNDQLIKCPFEFCYCPMKNFDEDLYNKALEKNGIN